MTPLLLLISISLRQVDSKGSGDNRVTVFRELKTPSEVEIREHRRQNFAQDCAKNKQLD